MKIKTHQAGGIVYLPTSNRREGAGTINGTASSSSGSSSESASKVPGFAKEIIPLLKENGIDSDVTTFLGIMEQTLRTASDPTGENLSMRDIIKVVRLANKVQQNYKAYANAEKSLDAQSAWGEPATNARGDLYVINKETKQLEEIPVSSFSEDKYVSITNADLLNIRRSDTNFAFDNKMLDSLTSAVGMKTISDFARQIIHDFGKTTITGYSAKETEKINRGAMHIIAGDLGDITNLIAPGPDGIYRIKTEETVVDSDLYAALGYLLNNFPKNYLNTLNAKAAAEHMDPKSMLLAMLYSNTSRSVEATYEHTASEDAGIGGASKAAAAEKLNDHDTYLMRIATGGEYTMAPIVPHPKNPQETGMYMAKVSNVGELVDDEGNRLEIGNLGAIFSKLEALKATNSKDITFGDQLLNLGEQNALIWDGSSQLTDVWLPFKTENGQIRPDFDKLRNFNKFNKDLEDHPNMTAFEKRQLMIKYNLNPEELIPLDNTYTKFQFKENCMKMFLSFSAIVNEKNIDLTDETISMLEELNNDTKKRYKDLYNNSVKYNTIARSKSSRAVNSAFKTGNRGDYYRGNVFIPIDSMWLAMHSSTNQNMTKEELTHFAQRSQAAKAISSARDPYIANLGQWQSN